MAKKKPPVVAPVEEPFHNPFAALAPKGAPRQPAAPKAAPPAPAPTTSPKRAVLRLERKGRGGKTATVITHLNLTAALLEDWSRDLRRSLGCGGGVEDDTLVFQGDHRERLAELLAERGVAKITQG